MLRIAWQGLVTAMALVLGAAACGGSDRHSGTGGDATTAGAAGAHAATGGSVATGGDTPAGGDRSEGTGGAGATTTSGTAGEGPGDARAGAGGATGTLPNDGGGAGLGLGGGAGTTNGGASGSTGGDAAAGVTGADDGGAAGSSAAGAGGVAPATPVWTDESASLTVTSWGLGTIYWVYEAARGQLTQDQLALLEQLTLTDPAEQPASCDVPHYSLVITAVQGTSASYSVTSPECTTRPHVSLADFQPLRETFGCDPQPTRHFVLERDYADPVVPSRCDYRYYPGQFAGAATWTRFQVPASTCRITVRDVALEVTLYDVDASQSLDTMTTPEDDGTSTTLEYAFATAGDYWVRLQSVDPAATSPGYVMFTCDEGT